MERLYAYDVVRVVAMIFVVAVHALMVVDVSTFCGRLYYESAMVAFISANALFFLMSGKFNIRVRKSDSDIKLYYLRRFRGFLLPILVFFLVRTLYETYPFGGGLVQLVKDYAKNALGVFGHTEYWFVFALFGFLVVAPFLGKMLDRLNSFECGVFIGIGFAYNTVVVVADNLGIDFSWGYLFSGFALTFCMGAMVERLVRSRKQFIALICVGLLSFVVDVVLRMTGYSAGSLDISPLFTIYAVALYMTILRLARAAKPLKVVSFMAKHSFGVYLTHMMVLYKISGYFYASGALGSVTAHFCLTITAFVLSLMVAVAVDLVAVRPLQYIFDKVTNSLIGTLKASK